MLIAKLLPRPLFLAGTLALIVVVVLITALLGSGGSPASTQDDSETKAPGRSTELSVATEPASLDLAVSWDAVDGASSYKVRWRRSQSDSTLNEGVVAESSSATITVSDYGRWVVRVEGCNDAGCGPGTTRTVQVVLPKLERPQNFAVSITAGELGLAATWDAVDGADSYRLRWRRHEGGFGDNQVFATDTNADLTVSDYGQWVVRLEACNDAGCGPGAAQTVAINQVLPAKPQNLVINNASGSLSISATWDGVDAADSYKVQWRRHDGAFAADNQITATAANAAITVSDYGRWVVRVEACNEAGCGPGIARSVQVVLPNPERPRNLGVTTEPGSLDVLADWDDVAGATFYAVHWRQVVPVTQKYWRMNVKSSEAATTVLHAGKWAVRVDACNQNGCGNGAVQAFEVEPAESVPDRPTGLEVSTQSGSLEVSLDWDDVEGATRYEVQWRAIQDIRLRGEMHVQSSDATITVGRAGDYGVRVRACNDNGCGESVLSMVQVKPAPKGTARPTSVQASTRQGSLEVSLDWDDVAGADSYLVRWREDSPGVQFNERVSVTASAASITVSDYGQWELKVNACQGENCWPGKFERFQVEAAPQGEGYSGQLGELLVELSLRLSQQQAGSEAAERSNGPSGQSSHTTSIVYVIDDSGSMDGDFPEVRTALRHVRSATIADTIVTHPRSSVR